MTDAPAERRSSPPALWFFLGVLVTLVLLAITGLVLLRAGGAEALVGSTIRSAVRDVAKDKAIRQSLSDAVGSALTDDAVQDRVRQAVSEAADEVAQSDAMREHLRGALRETLQDDAVRKSLRAAVREALVEVTNEALRGQQAAE